VISNLLPAQSITLFVLPPATTPILRPGTNASPAQLELWLGGQSGESYTLQASTNLVTWVPVSTNTLATNSFRYLLSTANAAQMFYRAELTQP
jgi:hypothetical protein